jgi:ABC-type transport system substrate-binding protein
MVAILVHIFSYILIILGFVHSHRVKSNGSRSLGLTPLGKVLVGIAMLGLLFGIVKEVKTIKENTENTRILKEIYAKLLGQAEKAPPEIAPNLRELAGQIRSLVKFEGGAIQPDLIESWEMNENATEITLKLKTGEKLADGSNLDSEKLKSIMDKNKENISHYQRSKVIDQTRIRVFLSEPNPFLIGELTTIEIPSKK